MSGGALRREYNTWRSGNISRLVETVYREAKKIRPDVMVSAAVFPNWDSAPHSIAQQSDEWVAKGWLDFICPMNYHCDNTALERDLRRQLASVGQRMPLYAGPGGSFLHERCGVTTNRYSCRVVSGAAGCICFQHSKGFAENFLPELAVARPRRLLANFAPSLAGIRFTRVGVAVGAERTRLRRGGERVELAGFVPSQCRSRLAHGVTVALAIDGGAARSR